jgi:hypothetical protein
MHLIGMFDENHMPTFELPNNNQWIAESLKENLEASGTSLTSALTSMFDVPAAIEQQAPKTSSLGPTSVGLYRERLRTSVYRKRDIDLLG